MFSIFWWHLIAVPLDIKCIFFIYVLIIYCKVWEGKDHLELYGIIKVLKCFHTLSGDAVLSLYLKIARQRRTKIKWTLLIKKEKFKTALRHLTSNHTTTICGVPTMCTKLREMIQSRLIIAIIIMNALSGKVSLEMVYTMEWSQSDKRLLQWLKGPWCIVGASQAKENCPRENYYLKIIAGRFGILNRNSRKPEASL